MLINTIFVLSFAVVSVEFATDESIRLSFEDRESRPEFQYLLPVHRQINYERGYPLNVLPKDMNDKILSYVKPQSLETPSSVPNKIKGKEKLDDRNPEVPSTMYRFELLRESEAEVTDEEIFLSPQIEASQSSNNTKRYERKTKRIQNKKREDPDILALEQEFGMPRKLAEATIRNGISVDDQILEY